MRRTFICGVALAACWGMANTAAAQYQTDYQYSSYGYNMQEETAPDASPSDIIPEQPAPQVVQDAPAAITPPSESSTPVSSCDGYYGNATTYGGCDGVGDNVVGGGIIGSGCDGGGIYGGGGGILGGGVGCGILGGGAGCGIGGGLIQSNDRNMTVGVRGLIFERDYEDDRPLGRNGLGQYLFTTDADVNTMEGFETFISSRGCNGKGWEIGYWGLFPNRADVTFNGPGLYTSLRGLAAVDLTGSAVDATFDTADSWRLYRFNEIHNVELNLLRNAGTTCGFFGGSVNVEWLAGFRWFKFSEDMRFSATNTTPPYPPLTLYDLDVENNLVGFQLGGRADRCLNDRWSLSLGTKFGVYNNDIYARQSIRNGAGTYATVGGTDYNFSSRKDEVATLGELDLGLNYQISCKWRANVGYRLLGVTSVALAADQIPYNFTDIANINRIKSNGSLLLHGAYFGVECAF